VVKYFLAFCLLFSVISGPLENCASNKLHKILLGPETKYYYLNKTYSYDVKVVRIVWTEKCVKRGVRVSYLEPKDIFFGGEYIFVTTSSDGDSGLKIPYECVEMIEPAELKET